MIQVLNGQNDSILVVHKIEDSRDEFEVEFCNSKSVELFGFDLKDTSKHEMKKFSHTLKRINKEQANEENVSLQEMIMNEPHDKEGLESYTINKTNDSEKENTIAVRRMNITFSKKKCQVLNFTDVTSSIMMEREKQKYETMKSLNTSVHHEMIGPLRAQKSISKSLQ